MYKCNNCGATFGEPLKLVETHDFPRPPWESWDVCPNCWENDIEEVAEA